MIPPEGIHKKWYFGLSFLVQYITTLGIVVQIFRYGLGGFKMLHTAACGILGVNINSQMWSIALDLFTFISVLEVNRYISE